MTTSLPIKYIFGAEKYANNRYSTTIHKYTRCMCIVYSACGPFIQQLGNKLHCVRERVAERTMNNISMVGYLYSTQYMHGKWQRFWGGFYRCHFVLQ